MKEVYLQIDKKIKDACNIAIITHRNPDGDTFWSASAFNEMIDVNFDNKNIDIINPDWIPDALKYLNNVLDVKKELDIGKYDLYIFLDVASVKLAGFLDEDNFNLKNVINIDHHISNNKYWDISLVDPDEPSTTAVLYNFFTAMNYAINENIATALLTWIYTDTGSLVFDNTTAKTFDIVSELIYSGWNIRLVSDNIFLNSSISFIKLLWLTLDRLVIKDNFWFSYLTKKDIEDSWCDYEELVWIVWRLNTLDEVDYTCFIYEKWNWVKWSLRTNQENMDLTLIAQKHWWWWHKKASAFIYNNSKIETNNEWKVFVRTADNNLIQFV